MTQHLALAAMGEVSSEATHPSVTTAGMTREVRVAHRKFPDGGWVIASLPDLRKTAHAQIVRTAFMLALRRPDVSLRAARQWTEDGARVLSFAAVAHDRREVVGKDRVE